MGARWGTRPGAAVESGVGGEGGNAGSVLEQGCGGIISRERGEQGQAEWAELPAEA